MVPGHMHVYSPGILHNVVVGYRFVRNEGSIIMKKIK